MIAEQERNERMMSMGSTGSSQAELSRSPEQAAAIEEDRAATGADQAGPAASRGEGPDAERDAPARDGRDGGSPGASETPAAAPAEGSADEGRSESEQAVGVLAEGETGVALARPGSDEDGGSSTNVTVHYALAAQTTSQAPEGATPSVIEVQEAASEPSGRQDRLDDLGGRMEASSPIREAASESLEDLQDRASDLLGGLGSDTGDGPLDVARDLLESAREGFGGDGGGGTLSESPVGGGIQAEGASPLARAQDFLETAGGNVSALSGLVSGASDGGFSTSAVPSGPLDSGLAALFEGDRVTVQDVLGADLFSAADIVADPLGLDDVMEPSLDWPVNDPNGGGASTFDVFDLHG